jgi:phosphatidylglycerol---prolipoprotein diacylglyceryl transferase
MCPTLFHIGPVEIHGFGLMLALGFIAGSYILTKEFDRLGLNRDATKVFVQTLRMFYICLAVLFLTTFFIQNSGPDKPSLYEFLTSSNLHLIVFILAAAGGYFLFRKQKEGSFDLANSITLTSLVFGVAGSKLLYIFENLSDFHMRPFDTLFSAGGLTFFGGFILVVLITYLIARKAGVSYLLLTDATVPGLMLGYGIGRIGCHLAGDGDYGFPTTLPWGTDYSNGTLPPSIAFRDFPEITGRFPGGIVPDTIPCHPTPVYEFIICTLMFLVMWKLRKKLKQPGKIFMLFLVFIGIERFSIEFLRLNPRLFMGLSEAQIIALLLIAAGLAGWWIISSRSIKPAAGQNG